MQVTILVTDKAVVVVQTLELAYRHGVMAKSGLLVITADRKDAPSIIALLKEEGFNARYDT